MRTLTELFREVTRIEKQIPRERDVEFGLLRNDLLQRGTTLKRVQGIRIPKNPPVSYDLDSQIEFSEKEFRDWMAKFRAFLS